MIKYPKNFLPIKGIEDLSVRSRNVLKSIGGIEAMLAHFYEYNSFLNIQNSGSRTNLELLRFCKHLTEKIESKAQVDFNSSYQNNELLINKHSIELVYFKMKNSLTIRALNIIGTLIENYGGNEYLFIQALLNGDIDFKKVRNCGNKTIIELRGFVKKINESITPMSNDIFNYHLSDPNSKKDVLVNSDEISSIYFQLRQRLSVRANNILNSWVQEREFSDDQLQLALINDELDFTGLRNCGKKTLEELNHLKGVLSGSKRMSDSENYMLHQNSLFDHKINLIFPFFNTGLISSLFCNQKAMLSKLLCAAIYYGAFKKNKLAVIRSYYFSVEELKFDAVADLICVSKERVRQIIVEFEKVEVKSILKKIRNEANDFFELDHLFTSKKLLIDAELLIWSEEKFFEILPNRRLINLIWKECAVEEFITLIEYFEREKLDNDILDLSNCKTLMVNVQFAKEINLEGLVAWCFIEIQRFESYGLDYDIEVLIDRFYRDQAEIKVESFEIKMLAQFFIQSKLTFKNSAVYRKGLKEQKQREVCSLSYDYIIQKGVPVKTSELKMMLEGYNIEVSTQYLLKTLNTFKNQFTVFGNGAWAISEWRSNGLIGGSLRDIVISKLNESKKPLHVSVLLDYISKYRKVSLHSLMSNLRFQEGGAFKFFNCNFIGLNNLKYDKYWDDLPKLNGRHFGLDALNNLMSSGIDIVKHYKKVYGYPEINTLFLLAKRSGFRDYKI